MVVEWVMEYAEIPVITNLVILTLKKVVVDTLLKKTQKQ